MEQLFLPSAYYKKNTKILFIFQHKIYYLFQIQLCLTFSVSHQTILQSFENEYPINITIIWQ